MAGINRNICVVSDQLDALAIDMRKIKSDIEEIKKATGDNAFEAMLDKPIDYQSNLSIYHRNQPKYLSPEDLYRSHGGQIK
jgi:hypothetical protein